METTILSHLSQHEWMVESSRHGRGWDWAVEKVGSQWKISGTHFAVMKKKFKTKTAAYKAYSEIVCAEARRRNMLQMEKVS